MPLFKHGWTIHFDSEDAAVEAVRRLQAHDLLIKALEEIKERSDDPARALATKALALAKGKS